MPAEQVKSTVEIALLVPCSEILGDDAEDTRLLLRQRDYAHQWLSAFEWCSEIRECYFGCGLGGVIAVFFMRIKPTSPKIDEYLWVIVGDIPSAYLVTDHIRTPTEALLAYYELMQDWVDKVRVGGNVKECVPVDVSATAENADALDHRLKTLQTLDIAERPEALSATNRS